MKEEHKKRCGVCEIPYFERNNFFYGKMMTVRDFFAEQFYFNEKRWLINRMVLGWGVVCGLDVRPKDNSSRRGDRYPGAGHRLLRPGDPGLLRANGETPA